MPQWFLNAASHNPGSIQVHFRYANGFTSDLSEIASEKTGPVSGQPPSASQETTAAILEASKDDSMGQIEGGRDRGDNEAPKKIKSAKGCMCQR